MAALFAATYPERMESLVLFHPWLAGPDHRLQDADEDPRDLREEWGTREFAASVLNGNPTLESDAEFSSWFIDLLRLGASPTAAFAFRRAMLETLRGSDFGDVYRAIRVPTLVLYRPYRPDAREMYGRVAD